MLALLFLFGQRSPRGHFLLLLLPLVLGDGQRGILFLFFRTTSPAKPFRHDCSPGRIWSFAPSDAGTPPSDIQHRRPPAKKVVVSRCFSAVSVSPLRFTTASLWKLCGPREGIMASSFERRPARPYSPSPNKHLIKDFPWWRQPPFSYYPGPPPPLRPALQSPLNTDWAI